MLFIYRKTAIPKRIKPTLITASNDVSPTSASSVSPFKSSGKKEIVLNATKSDDSSFADAFSVTKSGESICNFSEERELLKKEKMKWSNACKRSLNDDLNILSPVKSKPISNELKDWNVVCPEEVTFMAELQLLAELYSSLISNIALLRILVNIHRIETFSCNLKVQLNQMCLSDKQSLFYSVSDKSNVSGVSFQVDTDNKSNFATNVAFQTFRKQRDMFYEIIRDWERNHLTCGWSMTENLGSKIKKAVNLGKDPICFSHFARLFVAQLLLMCKGQRTAENKGQEEDFLALTNLMKSHPEKMKKLQERFIKPNHVGGPCPPPSFPGCQEFFKDFILILESPYFIQHLSNHLVSRIHELNQVEFDIPDYDQGTSNGLEMSVAYEVQEQYYTCLHDLKLLGKLLGFIIFLPYRTKEKLSECILSNELTIRSTAAQPIDILNVLNEAIVKQRKILVIPWIVEFLSMIDAVSSSTDYYQNIFALIVFIYRKYVLKCIETHADLLLLTSIGWLFQTPNFPESLIFENNQELVGKLKIVQHFQGLQIESRTLDNSNVVNQVIWYSCCPFLCELRILVSEFSAGISSQSEKVRKITPITNLNNGNAAKQEVQLQADLQYYFFSHKSPHLKKSVDFVSDRLASNALWHIRQKIIPEIYSWCTNFLKIMVDEFEDDESQDFKKIQIYSRIKKSSDRTLNGDGSKSMRIMPRVQTPLGKFFKLEMKWNLEN
ncbi:Codanin-1 [Nymphon striatum]|nr:Codanin-1 [Nymphon striatum]